MWKTFKQIGTVGVVTEPPSLAADELRVREHLQARILATLGRALCIRQVDAGSCNGCELEIHALNNAFYNIEGLGVRFVASPRHADLLLVTGPVARHMELALKRTYDAMPDPKLKDPLCGMDVDASMGRMETSQGKDYAFCSDACRDKFRADPARYAGKT